MDRIVIVGSGRLARAIARTWPARIAAVVARSSSGARDAAALATRARTQRIGDALDDPIDTLWLATTDAAIASTAATIAATRDSWRGTCVVHSSGALSLEPLAPFAARGAAVLALHPSASLRGDVAIAPDVIWGVTPGDIDSIAAARRVLDSDDVRLVPIDAGHRTLYHAAASAASNFSVTLFEMAEMLYERAGVERPLARELVAAFMTTSIERSRSDGPDAAITGPAVRGDEEVVAAQRAAVADMAPEARAAFDALAELTSVLFKR